jgi:hypothetical protein
LGGWGDDYFGALALSALFVYFVFRNQVPSVVLILLVVMLSPIVAFVSIMIVLRAWPRYFSVEGGEYQLETSLRGRELLFTGSR